MNSANDAMATGPSQQNAAAANANQQQPADKTPGQLFAPQKQAGQPAAMPAAQPFKLTDKMKVHAAGIAIICLILLAGMLAPEARRVVPYTSSFGMLALLAVMFVISIPLLARMTKMALFIRALAQRRWIGIYSFFFALIHVGFALGILFGWDFGILLSDTPFVLGTAAFVILVLMAATSNDYAVMVMGANWKRLQLLVYPAILLVIVHFVSLGAIFAKNQVLVAAILIAIAAVLFLKFKPK